MQRHGFIVFGQHRSPQTAPLYRQRIRTFRTANPPRARRCGCETRTGGSSLRFTVTRPSHLSPLAPYTPPNRDGEGVGDERVCAAPAPPGLKGGGWALLSRAGELALIARSRVGVQGVDGASPPMLPLSSLSMEWSSSELSLVAPLSFCNALNSENRDRSCLRKRTLIAYTSAR